MSESLNKGICELKGFLSCWADLQLHRVFDDCIVTIQPLFLF